MSSPLHVDTTGKYSAQYSSRQGLSPATSPLAQSGTSTASATRPIVPPLRHIPTSVPQSIPSPRVGSPRRLQSDSLLDAERKWLLSNPFEDNYMWSLPILLRIEIGKTPLTSNLTLTAKFLRASMREGFSLSDRDATSTDLNIMTRYMKEKVRMARTVANDSPLSTILNEQQSLLAYPRIKGAVRKFAESSPTLLLLLALHPMRLLPPQADTHGRAAQSSGTRVHETYGKLAHEADFLLPLAAAELFVEQITSARLLRSNAVEFREMALGAARSLIDCDPENYMQSVSAFKQLPVTHPASGAGEPYATRLFLAANLLIAATLLGDAPTRLIQRLLYLFLLNAPLAESIAEQTTHKPRASVARPVHSLQEDSQSLGLVPIPSDRVDSTVADLVSVLVNYFFSQTHPSPDSQSLPMPEDYSGILSPALLLRRTQFKENAHHYHRMAATTTALICRQLANGSSELAESVGLRFCMNADISAQCPSLCATLLLPCVYASARGLVTDTDFTRSISAIWPRLLRFEREAPPLPDGAQHLPDTVASLVRVPQIYPAFLVESFISISSKFMAGSTGPDALALGHAFCDVVVAGLPGFKFGIFRQFYIHRDKDSESVSDAAAWALIDYFASLDPAQHTEFISLGQHQFCLDSIRAISQQAEDESLNPEVLALLRRACSLSSYPNLSPATSMALSIVASLVLGSPIPWKNATSREFGFRQQCEVLRACLYVSLHQTQGAGTLSNAVEAFSLCLSRVRSFTDMDERDMMHLLQSFGQLGKDHTELFVLLAPSFLHSFKILASSRMSARCISLPAQLATMCVEMAPRETRDSSTQSLVSHVALAAGATVVVLTCQHLMDCRGRNTSAQFQSDTQIGRTLHALQMVLELCGGQVPPALVVLSVGYLCQSVFRNDPTDARRLHDAASEVVSRCVLDPDRAGALLGDYLPPETSIGFPNHDDLQCPRHFSLYRPPVFSPPPILSPDGEPYWPANFQSTFSVPSREAYFPSWFSHGGHTISPEPKQLHPVRLKLVHLDEPTSLRLSPAQVLLRGRQELATDFVWIPELLGHYPSPWDGEWIDFPELGQQPACSPVSPEESADLGQEYPCFAFPHSPNCFCHMTESQIIDKLEEMGLQQTVYQQLLYLIVDERLASIRAFKGNKQMLDDFAASPYFAQSVVLDRDLGNAAMIDMDPPEVMFTPSSTGLPINSLGPVNAGIYKSAWITQPHMVCTLLWPHGEEEAALNWGLSFAYWVRTQNRSEMVKEPARKSKFSWKAISRRSRTAIGTTVKVQEQEMLDIRHLYDLGNGAFFELLWFRLRRLLGRLSPVKKALPVAGILRFLTTLFPVAPSRLQFQIAGLFDELLLPNDLLLFEPQETQSQLQQNLGIAADLLRLMAGHTSFCRQVPFLAARWVFAAKSFFSAAVSLNEEMEPDLAYITHALNRAMSQAPSAILGDASELPQFGMVRDWVSRAQNQIRGFAQFQLPDDSSHITNTFIQQFYDVVPREEYEAQLSRLGLRSITPLNLLIQRSAGTVRFL